MSTARFSQVGWVGIVLGLSFACSGKVRDLGDKGIGGGGAETGGAKATGGKGAAGGSSSIGDAGTGNFVATGGKPPDATGGADSYGGDNATGGAFDATGGKPPDATGGAISYGGDTATGGATYSTGPATGGGYNQYPPPLGQPIDASCKCEDATQICDGNQECRARCNAEMGCAQWLTNRAVRSMYHDGTALYFATARSTDPLGNPGPTADGSLYRVTDSTGTPTVVTAVLPEPQEILGRYQSSLFLSVFDGSKTYSLYEVTDAGAATKLADSYVSRMSLQGKWLAYVATSGTLLMAIDLEAGRTPVDVASSGTSTFGDFAIVGDYVVAQIGTNNACSFSLTTPYDSSVCDLSAFTGTTSQFLAANASQLFFGGGSSGYLRAYDHLGSPRLIVFNDSAVGRMGATVLVGSWLHSATEGSWTRPNLIRYPTTVGRLPQEILSSGYGSELFAVGKTEVYWSYPAEKANTTEYVFQKPLPSQPCDDSLPCAQSAATCKDGFCVATAL